MQLSRHHEDLTDGVGKCSVPLWFGTGIPAGFCDRAAYGRQRPFKEYRMASGEWRRMDGGFNGYVPALACPVHGGPKAPAEEGEP